MKEKSVPLTPDLIGINVERSIFNNLPGFVVIGHYDNETRKIFYAKDSDEAYKILAKSLPKMEKDETQSRPPPPPSTKPEESDEDVLA